MDKQGLFAQYPAKIFVETGGHHGYGIKAAFEAGFQRIISIESDENLASGLKTAYKEFPNIEIVHGRSEEELPKVLKKIGIERITFWLDAHWDGSNTKGIKCGCPLLEELKAILNHPVNNHTILIDDVRLMGLPIFDWVGLGQVCETLWEINPDYLLKRLNSDFNNDILCASTI